MTPVTRAFLRAAADGDTGLVRGLLAQGTDINSVNQAGQTALMLAAGLRRGEIVTLLMNAGANVEVQDEMGLTARDWAGGATEILELLAPRIQQSEPPVVESAPEPVAVLEPVSVEPVSTQPPATPVVKPASQRVAEEPKLKGLAGAILRDHKPRFSTPVEAALYPPQEKLASSPIKQVEAELDDEPLHLPEIKDAVTASEPVRVTAEPIRAGSEPVRTAFEPIRTVSEPVRATFDDTIEIPGRDPAEDTAASITSTASRSRIFDLRSEADLVPPVPPLSKVEVPLPSLANQHHSRSYALLWSLVAIGLLAVGFASYRLGALLFAKPVTPPEASVAESKPEVQPTLGKAPPKVSGDLAGTELYLPDAEYPTDVSQNHNGTVSVQVRVSQKGIVFAAKAVDGDESFRAAAEQAAKNSAFSPDKLVGKSPVIDGTITYTFIHGQNSKPIASTQGTVTAVSGGPLAGTELQLVHAIYPSNAKSSGVGGQVTIVVRVNRNGRVMSWRPLGGDTRLRGAVIAAARKSTFAPTKLPGTGDVVGTITYTFQ